MASKSIDRIYWEAVQIASEEERAAYLERVCQADSRLHQRVLQLLKVRAAADNLLETPAAVATLDPPVGERPGTVIGPYKLLEQIGEGGMGLVFMAEQTRPVKRRVALKVLKPGMDTRQVVARFKAERQALAIMDHPHIARVFDAGVSDSGRPYFVMELVRGVAITEFCDERRYTTRQRLELFIAVCQAVQHAHQKGIIHRDLKPTNVLVTLHDTVAVPKVIDFGIAKATTQPLTERTLFTQFAQMVGTPMYMSPEQAEMNGLDVDTRSDVYALGVLLYELLTGTTPFESETLRKVDLDEMRRIIREEEPPTPSRRLNTLDAQACSTVSARRGVDVRRLGQALRGELDWVVMKALEKDRNRRYESASALAADVQRYLAEEAVAACPPSAGYRLRKYAWRHRRGLAMAGVIASALLAATAVSVWQAAWATRAQHLAEADRDRAKSAEIEAQVAKRQATEKAAIAQAVSNFLQDDLLRQASSTPQEDVGPNGNPNLTVREALDRASAKVAERFRDRPVVEAAVRMAIGDAYGGLDEHRMQTMHLERALELRRAHLGPNHPETVRSMERLADSYAWMGRTHDAIVMQQRVLAIARARLAPDDPELLGRMNALATAYRRAGDWRRAMQVLEQVVKKDEAMRGPIAAGASDSAHKLAMLYQDAGQYLESAVRQEKVLALRRSITGTPDYYVMHTCAMAYQLAGKLDDADRLMGQVVEHDRKGKGPMGQVSLARALELHSLIMLLQSRPAQAEALAREALALYEKNHHTEGEWRQPYVINLLGGTLLGQKKYSDAEPLLVQGYEGMEKGLSAMVIPWRFRLTEAGERVIRFYEETNQPDKAREWRKRLLRDESKK